MTCPACARRAAAHAKFCSECGAPLLHPARAAVSHTGRRQLTSMFCDIVNSTGIAEAMDPEDLHELILSYRDLCTAIIERSHGQVARLLGDGILVHYGFPAAREDGARLAVQSALEICERIPDLSRSIEARHGVRLAVRIGIHTGLVVIDEAAHGPARQGDGPVGNSLNVAFRLQEIAGANEVVISQDTQRLVQGYFIFETLGPRRLKGISRDVPAYRVVESSSARSLFEARATAGLSPLVGRDHQLGQLMQEWMAVRRGSPRSVLILGEPGIGKSRLMHEVQTQAEREAAVQITCHCLPHYQDTAFHPIAVELARLFSIGDKDGWPAVLAKVQAAMERAEIQDPRIGERIGLVFAAAGHAAGRPGEADASAGDVRRQIAEALACYVRTVAARVPLLLAFEDLHWADPSTLAFLSHLCQTPDGAPVLVLASARTDAAFGVPWDACLRLDRIPPGECRALIQAAAAGASLPPGVVDELVERSDGVPLFIEELTKSVRDGLDLRVPRPDARDEAAPTSVPAALYDSLMARLDRLGAAKEVAQVAAAIGRSFRFRLLSGVWGGVRAGLRSEVIRLVEAGLVFPKSRGLRRLDQDAAFEFKHELVRCVAYESLLRTARRDIHRRVAETLMSRHPEEADRHPELVAHHCAEAGLTEQALALWELAGQRAVQSSADLEAVAHFSRALRMAEHLPDTEDRRRTELGLQLRLAAPLMAAKGYGGPEMDRTLARAMVLSEEIGDATGVFPLMYARWSYQQVNGQVERALQLARRAAEMAERQDEPEPRMIAYRLLGTSLHVTGQAAAGEAALERSLRLFDDTRHAPLAYLYGADVKVTTLCALALARSALGRQASAEAAMEEAWQRSLTLGHGNTLAFCSTYRLALWSLCGRLDGFEDALLRHEALLAEHRPPVWRATSKSYAGWLRLRQGDPAGAAALLRECLEAMQAAHVVYWRATVLMWLGEALGEAGRHDEAEAVFIESLDVMTRSGERWAEAELYRLWGCMRLAAGGAGAADLLRKSLNVAERQGAMAFVLRTCLTLARQPGLLAGDMGSRLAAKLSRLPEQAGADAEDARALLASLCARVVADAAD